MKLRLVEEFKKKGYRKCQKNSISKKVKLFQQIHFSQRENTLFPNFELSNQIIKHSE